MGRPHVVLPKGPLPICDFCTAVPVRWDYPCRDFSHHDIDSSGVPFQFNSHNEWAACDACHAIIETGNRDALARRSVERYREVNPHAFPLSLRVARAIQDAFWANREGPPREVGNA